MARPFTWIASAIFALMALVHLYRLVVRFQIIIGTHSIPMWVSYVAIVVEAAVGKDGTVSVPRVDMAVDCGFAAYPDRIRSQMEGAAVMALSSALYGEITFRDGRAQQSNFNDFPIVRIDEAPAETRVHIVEHGIDVPASGVGEPGVPPFAPALCNAIFAATGKRIRSLPLKDQDLKPV